MAKPEAKTHEQAHAEKQQELQAKNCPPHVMQQAQAVGISFDQLIAAFNAIVNNLPEIEADAQRVWAVVQQIIGIIKPSV